LASLGLITLGLICSAALALRSFLARRAPYISQISPSTLGLICSTPVALRSFLARRAPYISQISP
jgi:hypothetical protein